jgi:hypothetical protein
LIFAPTLENGVMAVERGEIVFVSEKSAEKKEEFANLLVRGTSKKLFPFPLSFHSFHLHSIFNSCERRMSMQKRKNRSEIG